MNNDYMQEIGGMIKQVQEITKKAVSLIEPQVNAIIRNKMTDNNQIETLLDRLFDYAGMDENGLILFKRLCRYYYGLNPKVTADYIYAYRDLYDSDKIDEDD